MKLEVSALSFAYKNQIIFDNISFSAESGNICSLIGPNGAGKSTLIKCINGILRPSTGSIFADDIDVLSLSLKEKAAIFGYVPQFTTVNPCLNVIETVISGRMPHMRGRANQADIEKAEYILTCLGLEEYAFRPLHQLSGGERQRVLMARAFAQEPKILLLDEPTSNLDLHYQLETMEISKEVSAETNMTIISVIHDLNSVLKYSDHAVLLNDGAVFSDGKPSQVITEDNLASAFGVGVSFAESDGIPIMVPKTSLGNKIRIEYYKNGRYANKN